MRLQDVLGAGQGDADIPYDQTQPAQAGPPMGQAPPQGEDADVLAGAQAAAPQAAAPTLGMAGLSAPDAAQQMGAQPADLAANTDMLSDDELAAVDSPDAPDINQILNDPNLDEQTRSVIQQQVLMAARRQLAGL